MAQPLSLADSSWDANPIHWRFAPSAGTVRSRGFEGFAVSDSPRSARVRITARITPERTGTNSWSTAGIALVDDERNFWHVAFVQAPPEHGLRHTFELQEMRNGSWLAANEDRLTATKTHPPVSWSWDKPYDFTLESTPEGIRAQVADAAGKVVWEYGYAFPAPGANGTVRAVTCGRPALRVTGGFVARFASPDAVCSEPQAAVTQTVRPPAYVSESFVPGVVDRATGFFRVVEKEGRWWVIDPLGRGTVLLGIDHVTYRGHYSQRTQRSIHHEVNKKRFPKKADWEADTLARLKSWGFNMLGAGCDRALYHRGLIHTVFLSLGDELCWNLSSPEYYIYPNEHRPCSAFPNVFHPDFPAWADYMARRKCAPHKDDPWLFGYFIDNELAWWGRGAADTGLFDGVAKLLETHPARLAQKKFLAARGVKGTPSAAVKLDFLREAADIYFRVTSAAIRRHDPNHLVMGARFAGLGGAHPVVWEASGRYCDLVTFNCYPWADLDRNVVLTHRGGTAKSVADAFAEYYGYVKKPMLITEWSFPALDSGLPCTGGAGQRFRTQALRTQATELFAKTMLALPYLVGYDYFMWVDQPAAGISDAFPEDSNYGLLNERGEAYPEITAMFTRLQRDIGTWRRAGVPAANPAPPRPAGLTAADFLARAGAGDPAQVTYVREGAHYVIRNAAGLELRGRVGGSMMFERVKLAGDDLGQYTGMWNPRVKGGHRWYDAGTVVAAEWREENGRGSLFVTCEDRAHGRQALRMTHAITVFADRPWFLCDFVSAKNVGTEPIEMNALYFRMYSPFAADKQRGNQTKTVPNLWKAPSCDAWFRADDRAYYGGITFAPTVSMFGYHLMNDGQSQHPDAMFVPEAPLKMDPGDVYAPAGRMWMLALCGRTGYADWKQTIGKIGNLAMSGTGSADGEGRAPARP